MGGVTHLLHVVKSFSLLESWLTISELLFFFMRGLQGVMMSHGNMVATIAGVTTMVPGLGSKDVYLAYLPLAHVLEIAAEVSIVYIYSDLVMCCVFLALYPPPFFFREVMLWSVSILDIFCNVAIYLFSLMLYSSSVLWRFGLQKC
jgi:hypothetical protein